MHSSIELTDVLFAILFPAPRAKTSTGFKLKRNATLWSTITREGNKSDLVCRGIVVDRRAGES